MYERFPFRQEDYTEEGAAEIAEWALNQNIQDFPGKLFRAFVWEIVESNDNHAIVETQSFFGFVHTTWTKVGTPSLDQLVAVRKTLDNHVHATGIDIKWDAWKRFYSSEASF